MANKLSHSRDWTALTVETAFALLMCQYVIFPRVAMWLKALTLLVLMAAVFIQLEGNLSFTRNSLLLAVYILVNIICTVIGVVRGYADVALRSSTVNIIWPATYLIFSGYSVSEEQLCKFYKLLICIVCFMFFIDIVVILADHRHWSFIKFVLAKLRLEGYSCMTAPYFRTQHIYFYAFFVPFMFSSALRKTEDIRKSGVDPRIIRILAVYALCLTVIAGMGAIWLSISIGVAISICRFVLTSGKKAVLFFVIAVIVVLIFVTISYHRKGLVFVIIQKVLVRLGKNDMSKTESTRINQIKAMIEAWLSHPLFGNGLGYPISYVRDGMLVEQSGNEMSYFAMLYQTGLAGTGMFFAVAFQSIRMLLQRRGSEWICQPFAVGTISFLIGNFFNPYLSNMSALWILFLPFILGNREGSLQDAVVINPIKMFFRRQNSRGKTESVM